MTLVPAPAQLCQVLSQHAVQNARQDIRGRGWKSSGALMPASAPGEVGISTSLKYLLYQNNGIKSFLMYWVEGRNVPMACGQGDGPHFRRGKGVGEPGYVNIPHKGKVFRPQKWKYPGLKPKRFIESAITKAIKENRDYIQQEVMATIGGKGKEDAKWL